MNTIASLLEAMTQEDKDDTVIVIFIGEVMTDALSRFAWLRAFNYSMS